MTQLKPCPFCGDEPTYRERRDEDLATHSIVTWRRVHCLTCDAAQETPDGYEGGTAVERWNRRAGEEAILEGLREEVAHGRRSDGRDAAMPERVIMVRESEWREMREALRDCIEALGNSHPGADDYWRACYRAEDALAKAKGGDDG